MASDTATAFLRERSVFPSVDHNLDGLDMQTLQRIRGLLNGGSDAFGALNALAVSLSRLGQHCTTLSKELRATSISDQHGQTTISEVFDQLEQLLSIPYLSCEDLTQVVLSLVDKEPVVDHNHPYIFRAHVATKGKASDSEDLPTFRADMIPDETEEDLRWDTHCQLCFNLDQFAAQLGKHLNKNQDPFESFLVSTSPDLEWTVHLTVQRGRRCSVSETAGLAIFSVEAIHKIAGATLLPTERVFTYLDDHGKGHHINKSLRTWAKNCQEHISMNHLPREALVSWIPWTDLVNPSPTDGLLLPEFQYWYTLGKFRTNHYPVDIDVTDYVARVVSFARALEGEEGIRTYDFVKLVVAASDWGYCGRWKNDDVLHLAKVQVESFSLEGGFASLALGS